MPQTDFDVQAYEGLCSYYSNHYKMIPIIFIVIFPRILSRFNKMHLIYMMRPYEYRENFYYIDYSMLSCREL